MNLCQLIELWLYEIPLMDAETQCLYSDVISCRVTRNGVTRDGVTPSKVTP